MKKLLNPTTALVPCPAILLSVAGEDTPNIITLSWAANICSKPPTIGLGIRPSRYSYDMVKSAGEYVINIPGTDLLESTKFCGTKSGRDHDKFAECGLTPIPATKINAPIIKECPINLECKTTDIICVGAHDLFIAEIVAVHIDEEVLDERGRFDASKVTLFTYLPLTGEYWGLGNHLK